MQTLWATDVKAGFVTPASSFVSVYVAACAHSKVCVQTLWCTLLPGPSLCLPVPSHTCTEVAGAWNMLYCSEMKVEPVHLSNKQCDDRCALGCTCVITAWGEMGARSTRGGR